MDIASTLPQKILVTFNDQIVAIEYGMRWPHHVYRAQKELATHWGRVTHICVGNSTIIGSDYGLSPGRRQDIIWTNDVILNIVNWTLWNKLQRNFNRYSNIFIQENGIQNVVCEMASILSRAQCFQCKIGESKYPERFQCTCLKGQIRYRYEIPCYVGECITVSEVGGVSVCLCVCVCACVCCS